MASDKQNQTLKRQTEHDLRQNEVYENEFYDEMSKRLFLMYVESEEILKRWNTPIPLKLLNKKIDELISRLYCNEQEANQVLELSNTRLLKDLWNNFTVILEEPYGEINVNFEEWINLITNLPCKSFASVHYSDDVVNKFINLIVIAVSDYAGCKP